MKIADTDDGKDIAQRISDLDMLLDVYRDGTINQNSERL